MPLINAVSDFESTMPQTGIVAVLMYEQRSCPACQQLKDVFTQLSVEHPEITVMLVNVIEAKTVKFKYGIVGSGAIIFFKEGVFVKRYFQPIPNIKIYEKAIDRLKSNLSVDLPEECNSPPPMRPTARQISVPLADLPAFIINEQNMQILGNPTIRHYRDGDNMIFFGPIMVADTTP